MVTQSFTQHNHINTRTPINPIEVVEEERGSWQTALLAGERRGLTIERRGTWNAGAISMTGYLVQASTVTGHTYAATVSRDFDGGIWTTCECTSGMQGLPCAHAALALEAAQLWPFDARVDAPEEAVQTRLICWHCRADFTDATELTRHLLYRHNAASQMGRVAR